MAVSTNVGVLYRELHCSFERVGVLCKVSRCRAEPCKTYMGVSINWGGIPMLESYVRDRTCNFGSTTSALIFGNSTIKLFQN